MFVLSFLPLLQLNPSPEYLQPRLEYFESLKGKYDAAIAGTYVNVFGVHVSIISVFLCVVFPVVELAVLPLVNNSALLDSVCECGCMCIVIGNGFLACIAETK